VWQTDGVSSLIVNNANLSLVGMANRYGMVFVLLLIMPISKDGPLNIDLATLKTILVILLLIVTLPNSTNSLFGVRQQQIEILAVFLVLLTLVSILVSDARDYSINMTQMTIASLLLMIALCRSFDRKILRLGLVATIIVSLIICIVAILQYVVVRFHLTHPYLIELLAPEHRVGYFDQNMSLGEEGIRVSSIFFHSNQLGHYLATAFALFFPLSLFARSDKYQILYSLVVVALVVAMFMSQSRGGLILLALSFALTLFFYGKKRLFRWKNTFVILGAAIAAGVGVFTGNIHAFLSRLITASLSSREINWSYALNLIPENILYGVGRGASGYHMTQEFPAVEYVSLLNNYDAGQTVNYWANNPHNYYLATALEAGIFSLVAEIMLFGLMIRYGLRIIRSASHSTIKALAVGATTILFMEFVRGLFEAYSFLVAPETAVLTAFMCAMLLYLDKQLARSEVPVNKLGRIIK